MDKIALVTLHAIKNYGSVLQTFATQEIFREFGFDTTVVNYIREDARNENLLDYWCGKNPVKRLAMLPTLIRWKKIFDGFLEKYIHLSPETYYDNGDFKKHPVKADLYCTGSDQVWNTGWNGGIIPFFFLNFAPKDAFRFAYAASFGKKELSGKEVEATRKYIEKYQDISVREDYAKEMLGKYYDYKDAVHVVDPTLAYNGDFWRKYAPKSKIKGDYILVYNLNRSKEFDEYTKEISKRTGLPIYFLCRRYDQILRPGKPVLVPDVFEFITLIDHAKMVITDSFHATAFSLNLQPPPVCIYPSEYGGRLESILRMTGTLHRHVESMDDFDVVNRKVDFSKVENALQKQREYTREYLVKVFDDYKEWKK